MNRYLEKIAAKYSEGPHSTFQHDGSLYSVDKALEVAADFPVVQIPVKDLAWVLRHAAPDKARVEVADPRHPMLVTYWNGLPVAVDGLHRLAKALEEGLTHVPAKVLSTEHLSQAHAI